MIESQAGFFTHHPETLRQQLDSVLGTSHREIDPSIMVAPYGTLQDIGSICGTLYGSLTSVPNSVVLLGANEASTSAVAYPDEDINTPLGSITVDTMFKQRLGMSDEAVIDNTAFSISRSLLPHIAFLKHLREDITLSPLLLSPSTDADHLEEVTTVLSNLLTPEDMILVVGRLGRERVRDPDEVKMKLQRTDSGFITEMRQRNRREIIEYGKEHSIDLAGPLALALGLRGPQHFQMMGHRTWIDDHHDLVGGCIGYYR
ncbi:MAG: AmmeMemoRadiSam system protein B [Candidatus Nanohaloarchaeota archaeon QJJ-5]|nr:AmmeMemoRadiSam system protein B [Candidatus Nanohaloarchaeota archaeon QJJ-5]